MPRAFTDPERDAIRARLMDAGRELFARRGIRATTVEQLARAAGISKGAFYLFPNIVRTGLKSTEFCAKLLEQEKVAMVPGIAFGADDYVRISYATSMANIEKGLDRMELFCQNLRH